ncbi:MAG: DNA polymerase III subunit delta [Bacteroidia bacterium]|nr:DNA polymerase III subunit delta [Bacteroidia bacterium]
MHVSADHRIVVLHGKESFLRSEHTRRVLDALRERFGAVDEFSFDGASCSLADVLDELRSYGLMSQHKVVVVDNAEQFMQGDDRRRAMERYAESPMPDATLILRSAGWRPGTFDKLVAAVGVILKCEAPGAAEAVRWAVARSQKRHGVELSAAGAQALVERVGPDLGRLDSELGKLAVGALAAAQSSGQGSTSENSTHVVITAELVKEFTGLSREEQAWEIQGALATGDPAQALNKVDELLRVSRAPEVMLTWSTIDLVRKVHDAAALAAQGQPDGAIAKQLKLWGDGAAVVLRVARSVPLARAAALLQAAVAADRRMKSGLSPEPSRAIEALAVQVSSGLGRSDRSR